MDFFELVKNRHSIRKFKINKPVSDEDVVAAYQLGGGVSFRMNENISLDLSYRYFVPSDPDFNTVETEFASHNVSLGLRISL